MTSRLINTSVRKYVHRRDLSPHVSSFYSAGRINKEDFRKESVPLIGISSISSYSSLIRSVGHLRGDLKSLGGPSLVVSRNLSSTDNSIPNDTFTDASTTTPPFSETMSKLAPSLESPNDTSSTTSSLPTDIPTDIPTEAVEALPWEPTWYNLADQAINIINQTQSLTSLSYASSIALITLVARVGLFPLYVSAQRNSSRLAHVKPEMESIRNRMEQMGSNIDQKTQVRMMNETKAIFAKYGCNPMKSFVLPFVQAPLFMGFFFGLKKMPLYFPEEMANGGLFWFTDLSVSDPLYVLPVYTAVSFLLMMELGKEQLLTSMPGGQGQTALNVFRMVGLALIPISTTFSSSVLVYWATNNSCSLAQAAFFRIPGAKKSLGIWDPPKPVPGASSSSWDPEKGVVDNVRDMVSKATEPTVADRIKENNRKVENRKRLEEKFGVYGDMEEKDNAQVGRKAGRVKRRRGRSRKK